MKNIIFIVLCLWSFNSSGQQYVWDNAIFAESHNNTMPVYRMELTQADEKVVLGYYRDSLNIANQSLYSTKNYGIFLAKYNAHNDLLWVKTIAERNNLVSGNTPSVEVDNFNNIYIGLTYIDTLYINNNSFCANSNYDYYANLSVLKYDSNGNQLLHLRLDGDCGKFMSSDGLTVDEFQNIYLSASYGTLFDEEPPCDCIIGEDTLNTSGAKSFLSKFDSDGSPLWVTDAKGIEVLKLDGSNLYISGHSNYGVSIDFNDFELDFPSFYDYAGYIAKFDTSGVFHWAKHFGVQAWDSHLQILDLHIVSDNNIILAGKSYTQSVPNQVFFQNSATLNGDEWGGDDYFLVSYDSLGNINWQDIADCTYDDYFHKLTHDGQDNLYAAGKFSGSMYFGEDTLTSYGSIDAMVCSYDSLGNKRWAKNIGGSGLEFARGIGLDHEENLYVLGSTKSSTFHLGETSYELDNTYTQMFLAKLKLSGIGVEEIDLANTIELYPNPNAGAFEIRSEKNIAQWAVFNLLGEKMAHKIYNKPQTNPQVELHGLAKGLYVVRWQTEDNKFFAKKMMVE